MNIICYILYIYLLRFIFVFFFSYKHKVQLVNSKLIQIDNLGMKYIRMYLTIHLSHRN